MIRREIEEDKQKDEVEEEECKKEEEEEAEEQMNERSINILMEHSYDVTLYRHICKIANISKKFVPLCK